jgi:signal transduction histidine kinase
LSAESSITAAYLFDKNNNLFSSYGVDPAEKVALPQFGESLLRFDDDVKLYFKLRQDGEVIGTLLLKGNTRNLYSEFRSYSIVVATVMFACFILTLILSNLFQKSFSAPIVLLVSLVKKVSGSGDYSLRIGDKLGTIATEEFNVLAREFDKMLSGIQTRDELIKQANQTLEFKIEERSLELKKVQKIALQNAHSLGMAEISNGILHNIGNIVNSANISISEISSVLTDSKMVGFLKANDLLKNNKNNLEFYLTQDPSGKLLPQYFLHIGEVISRELEKVNLETQNLAKKIHLIKDVVITQQSYARGDILNEEIHMAKLLEEIISMQNSSFSRHSIQIVRKFQEIPTVQSQKIKVSHILLNLLKNAKEAMDSTDASKRILTVETEYDEKNGLVLVKVSDTGEGILPENLNKIFNHGFTTKKKGHGFGLHFCANAMKEMGGSLTVQNNTTGVTFVLGFKVKQPRSSETKVAG